MPLDKRCPGCGEIFVLKERHEGVDEAIFECANCGIFFPKSELIDTSIPDYDDEELENCFTYHTPKDGQAEKYEKIREAAKTLAYIINGCCPVERGERYIAMQHLDAAVFFANASIARS